MGVFSVIPSIDQDIEQSLIRQMKLKNLNFRDSREVELRVKQLPVDGGGIQWLIDEVPALTLNRIVVTESVVTYSLEIHKIIDERAAPPAKLIFLPGNGK